MRIFAVAAAALLLAGCTDADWAHVMSYAPVGTAQQQAEPGPPNLAAPMATVPAAATASAVSPSGGARTSASARAQQECVEWAGQRAEDATNQNFDEETARVVRDATYSDCMTWASRLHR